MMSDDGENSGDEVKYDCVEWIQGEEIADGFEFLKQVAHESSKIPDVLSVERTLDVILEDERQQKLAVLRAMYGGDDIESDHYNSVLSQRLIPDHKWIQTLVKFVLAHRRFYSRRRSHFLEDSEIFDEELDDEEDYGNNYSNLHDSTSESQKQPTIRNQNWWRERVWNVHLERAHEVCLVSCEPFEIEQLVSWMSVWLGSLVRKSKKEESTVLQLSQIREKLIESNVARCIFILLILLEKPINADTAAAINALVVSLNYVRSKIEDPKDPLASATNIITVICSSVFGQHG